MTVLFLIVFTDKTSRKAVTTKELFGNEQKCSKKKTFIKLLQCLSSRAMKHQVSIESYAPTWIKFNSGSTNLRI